MVETMAEVVQHMEYERLTLEANADACMQAHCHQLQHDMLFVERVEVL